MQSVIVKGSFIGLIGAVALLVGCGGGGGGGGSTALSYTGNTAPVVIDAANAEAVGVSVADNAAVAIDADTVDANIPFGATLNLNKAGSPLSRKISEISRQILESARSSNQPVGVVLSYTDLNDFSNAELGGAYNYFCGGSVSMPDGFLDGSTQSGTISINNLCFDIRVIDSGASGTIEMNGNIVVSVSGNTETTSYSNFTVTYEGETFTFSGTEECTISPYSCSTLYVGADGDTYKVSDVNVFGDDVSGYYVSATFFHPTYGAIDVSTSSPVTFCATGYPDGGVINFSGAGGVTYGSITFNSDCMTYDISYFDGLASGAISGSW